MGANRSALKSALRQAAAILLLASALGLAVGALRGTLSLSPPAGVHPAARLAEGRTGQAEGLTPRQAQQLLAAGAIPLDARRPEDFAAEHLPGALNLPAEEFDRYFPRIRPHLDPGRPLVVYCGSGECTLSHELAEALRPLGFARVEILRGGLEAWKAAGLGVEQ